MSKNIIRVHKDELSKILTVLEKFPDVKFIDIKVCDGSGIGYTTEIAFDHQVNEIDAEVKIMITDVDTW